MTSIDIADIDPVAVTWLSPLQILILSLTLNSCFYQLLLIVLSVRAVNQMSKLLESRYSLDSALIVTLTVSRLGLYYSIDYVHRLLA